MVRDIRILTHDQNVEVNPGRSILAASMTAGIKHMHLFGEKALCTSCRLEVEEGTESLFKMETSERISLRGHHTFSGKVRLACQAIIEGPETVKTIFPTIRELDFKGP